MVRPNAAFRQLAKSFVCVRVVNMDGIDLNRYRFDYDLTFAALTMNAAGTIYHRYGGRDASGPETYLSMPSLLDVMRATLEAHQSPAQEPPRNGPRPEPRTIRDLEPYNSLKLKERDECVHCHMVHTAQRVEARAKNTFERRDIWIWPEPARVGLTLDPEDQPRVAAVAPQSAGERAGLVAGDRLLKLGGTRIASFTDVQSALHDVPWAGGKLAAQVRRADETKTLTLELAPGWRAGSPQSFAWRASKWGLQPAPGFGGRAPSAEQLRDAGLPAGTAAFRVDYLVTWGENKHLGGNAHRAGLRQGDLVLKVGGERFESGDHFHSWFRLTRRVGEKVPVEIVRNGERKTVELTVAEGRAF